MAISPDDLSRRLHNAQESLDTELKPWQDPSVDWGKAIIAKACMALRNNNGGILIIGLNDDGSCDDSPKVTNIETAFNHDAVQEIVSKHSSERFEVVVHLVERGAFKRVMLEVPSGVRTPVISRNNLPKIDTAKVQKGSLLPEGQVFVRTLESNGRPSSSIAAVADWPRLMEYCFNNREADYGGPRCLV